MIEYSLSGPIPPLEEIATPITAPVEPGPPDLLPRLLPKHGQLVIAGETNSGKSLIALEICSSLVTGTPLWGEIEPTAVAQRILFCLGEHYDNVIRRLAIHTKLPMSDQIFLLGPEKLSWDKWLVVNGRPNQVAITKLQKWSEKCDLVVFDPMSAFLTGGGEAENDNITMRLVLDSMSLITQTNGAACLVLAHQGKPMMNQYGQETKRRSYAIRGASAIEDAATNIFYLERGDSSDVVAQATGGHVYDLVCRKFKGESVPKFTLLRNKDTLTHRLLSGKPYADVKKLEARAKIARLREDNPLIDERTAIRLVASIEGVSEDTIKRWIGLLVD